MMKLTWLFISFSIKITPKQHSQGQSTTYAHLSKGYRLVRRNRKNKYRRDEQDPDALRMTSERWGGPFKQTELSVISEEPYNYFYGAWQGNLSYRVTTPRVLHRKQATYFAVCTDKSPKLLGNSRKGGSAKKDFHNGRRYFEPKE